MAISDSCSMLRSRWCDGDVTPARRQSSTSSQTAVTEKSHCHCQQRDTSSDSRIKSCSLSSSRRYRHSVSIINPLNFTTMSLAVVSFLTCCVSAWPILNHRRTLNYAPASLVVPDYNELIEANQWALAAQPETAYYDSLPQLPLQQQPLEQDVYDDDQLYDQIPEEVYQLPYFGPIVDPVEPKEELELEELKHEQPYVYEKRRPVRLTGTMKPNTGTSSVSVSSTTVHPSSTTKAPLASTVAPSFNSKLVADDFHLSSPILKSSIGQKEIAMLRPPSSPKSHHIQFDEPEEPKISLAQRSLSNEKPSAYDRLRKYLSLDDALKKEYQQRRTSAMNRRHTKRASIIMDSDSLTGQLNSLKKKDD